MQEGEDFPPLVAGKPETGEGLSWNFTLGVQRSGILLTIRGDFKSSLTCVWQQFALFGNFQLHTWSETQI